MYPNVVQFYQYFPIPSATPESIPVTEYIPDLFVCICEKPDISSDRSAFCLFITTMPFAYGRPILFRETFSAEWEEGHYVRQYYYYRTVQIVSFFIFMFCFY